MPSFYPRSMARHQLPLTPPDYPPPYSGNTYAGMQYHQSYQQPAAGGKSDGAYDYTNRRSAGLSYQSSLPSMVYQQPTAYSNPSTTVAPTTQYYSKMAPILPPLLPMRPPTYEQAMAGDVSYTTRHESAVRDDAQAQSKAEKPIGGVSATLDYDMETMTDFVTEMAHGIIQLGQQQNVDPTFRKWVHQVLCATRLPSATILLSLHYLSMRMTQLAADQRRGHANQRQRMLTVALILGSKFLDDNTFINRSWSEVSGIEVSVLNWMEIDWFVAMDHRLHRDPKEHQGFDSWERHWKDYERQVNARNSSTVKLSPLDTNIPFHKSARPSWSPMPSYPSHNKRSGFGGPGPHIPEPMQLDTPAYTSFDSAWLYPRSTNESSPASAPHTGPTTPEYYSSAGSAASWPGHEGYSRRTMFGFPPSHSTVASANQAQSQQLSQFPYYNLPPVSYIQAHNGHGMGCTCFYCTKSPSSYFLSHHAFGQAMSVAG